MADDHKIDMVLQSQEETKSQLKVLLTLHTEFETNMERRFKGLEDDVGEVIRTIRGFNGTQGLVTTVELMRQNLDSLKKEHEREIKTDHGRPDTKQLERYVSFPWLMDKFGVPVITAILIWLILTFVPSVQTMLNVH